MIKKIIYSTIMLLSIFLFNLNITAQSNSTSYTSTQSDGTSYTSAQSDSTSYTGTQSGGTSYTSTQSGGTNYIGMQNNGINHATLQSNSASYTPPQSDSTNYTSTQSGGTNYIGMQNNGINHATLQSNSASYTPPQSDSTNYTSTQSGGTNYTSAQNDGINHATLQSDGASYTSAQSDSANYTSAQSVGTSYTSAQSDSTNYTSTQSGGKSYIGMQNNGIDHATLQSNSESYTSTQSDGTSYTSTQSDGTSYTTPEDATSTVTPEQEQFVSDYQYIYDESGLEELEESLPDEVNSQMDSMGIDPSDVNSVSSFSIGSIFSTIAQTFKDRASAPIKAVAGILAIIILSAIVESLTSEFSDNNITEVFNYICAGLIAIMILLPILKCATAAANDIRICAYFMLGFIPIYAAMLVASGKVATAAGYQTALFAVTEIIVQMSTYLMVPFMGMHMALSAAGTVSSGVKLDGMSNSIKKVTIYALNIGMIIFIAILSFQTTISSAGDTATMRTTKFVVGSSVPIVGSYVGDALGSLQSCFSLIKASTGLYAVVAMFLILLPALVEVIIWKISIFVCSSVSDMFELSQITKFLQSVNSSLSILLAILVSCFTLFVVSTTLVVMVGG